MWTDDVVDSTFGWPCTLKLKVDFEGTPSERELWACSKSKMLRVLGSVYRVAV